MSDEHQIPWGFPGPTDPVERANANNINMTADPLRYVPLRWSQDGVPDVEQDRAEARRRLFGDED